MRYISNALKINQKLKTIDLQENEIGKKGAKFLGESLAKNRDLFEIDLRGNLIEDDAKEWLEQNFFRRKFYI
jgi:hypothetical protein